MGTDNGVRSRWRNPDGSWSAEQNLGGTGINVLTAAQVAGTDVLQLFYVGTGNHLKSRWRNPNGSWSDEQNLGGQVLNVQQVVAAQVPGTDILQLFYLGPANAIWTRWRNPDGTWSNEQKLGGTVDSKLAVAVIEVPTTRKWHADITFKDSTPLGGWADFVADNTGAFTFSGHMHDSGFDPISFTVAVAIITSTGQAYGFGVSGRCAGHNPLSGGNVDYNWMGTQTNTFKDENGNVVPNPNPAIAAHWSEVVQGQMEWRITAQDLTAQGIVDFVVQQVKDLATQAAQKGEAALIALLVSG